jgi:catechol 2,3-dioxygenase-like lactoylglutathione lyase family enzyme
MRLFHANVNCTDLERSRRFYVDGLGLDAGAHTAPESAQSGAAFGLDRARWDAWILVGRRGFEGGAIDLLEWQEPPPTGAPPARLHEQGFQRIAVLVPDLDRAIAGARACGGTVWSEPFVHNDDANGSMRLVFVSDPDGTAVELIEGGGPQLSVVAVTCADLARSRAFYSSLGMQEVASFASERDDGTHMRIDGPVAMEEVVLAAPGGGDVFLILVGFRTPAVVEVPLRPAHALGLWRAAFLVPDLDAAVAGLAGLGIATLSEPAAMAMGPGLPDLRFVCFRGPDDEVLELIEQP